MFFCVLVLACVRACVQAQALAQVRACASLCQLCLRVRVPRVSVCPRMLAHTFVLSTRMRKVCVDSLSCEDACVRVRKIARFN